MMSGGLGFAVEVVEPDEFEHAVEGFRYFDSTRVANLLADLVESYGSPDYDEQKEASLNEMTGEGDPIF